MVLELQYVTDLQTRSFRSDSFQKRWSIEPGHPSAGALLVGVIPADPPTFVTIGLVLTWQPSWALGYRHARSIKVDPTVAA